MNSKHLFWLFVIVSLPGIYLLISYLFSAYNLISKSTTKIFSIMLINSIFSAILFLPPLILFLIGVYTKLKNKDENKSSKIIFMLTLVQIAVLIFEILILLGTPTIA